MQYRMMLQSRYRQRVVWLSNVKVQDSFSEARFTLADYC